MENIEIIQKNYVKNDLKIMIYIIIKIKIFKKPFSNLIYQTMKSKYIYKKI